EIVHNNFIVKELASRGVHFAESLDEVPSGARLLLSAHGVGAAVEERARSICGELVDATCPLVKRLHDAASRCRPGEVLILIGHRGHPEVE
ncbi:4-hydroxy-3-methylbut-2-enyl diphosphate reductase, partial [Xanthomonas citri pv. citri]|nr:4-hydroxy-3-methylbut-2-enyl diphosphate reductase [Xanthomonas citri pv. citri]